MRVAEQKLGAVQETFLLSVYLRALETRRTDAIIQDEKAVEIVNSLDYDFSKFAGAEYLQLGIAICTEIFDEAARAFIAVRPDATVVNLGAGLDSRYLRLDNRRIRWIDLDLPEVIAIRRRYYQESPRNFFLEKSAFDLSWIGEIDVPEGRNVLLIAECLFQYFEEMDLKRLFAEVASTLPGTEILFESISPLYVGRQDIVPALNQTGATLKWGIQSGREIEFWDRRFRFINEWACVDRHRRRWGWLSACLQLPGIHQVASSLMKVTHLQLGG